MTFKHAYAARFVAAAIWAAAGSTANATIIRDFDFNTPTDFDFIFPVLSGSAGVLPGTGFVTSDIDPSLVDAYAEGSSGPAGIVPGYGIRVQCGSDPDSENRYLEFFCPSVGFENLIVYFDAKHSSPDGHDYINVLCSVDGTNWFDLGPGPTSWVGDNSPFAIQNAYIRFARELPPSADENPDLRFRLAFSGGASPAEFTLVDNFILSGVPVFAGIEDWQCFE